MGTLSASEMLGKTKNTIPTTLLLRFCQHDVINLQRFGYVGGSVPLGYARGSVPPSALPDSPIGLSERLRKPSAKRNKTSARAGASQIGWGAARALRMWKKENKKTLLLSLARKNRTTENTKSTIVLTIPPWQRHTP